MNNIDSFSTEIELHTAFIMQQKTTLHTSFFTQSLTCIATAQGFCNHCEHFAASYFYTLILYSFSVVLLPFSADNNITIGNLSYQRQDRDKCILFLPLTAFGNY